MLISDTVSTFVTFLRQLLGAIPFPGTVHRILNTQLDTTSTILYSVIASNKKIASDLQRDEECGQETLNEMKSAQDFIQRQMGVSIQKTNAQSSTLEEIAILKHTKLLVQEEGKEMQPTITKEVDKIPQPDGEHVKL